MDINHGHAFGDAGKAGEAPTVPARPKPKLFSMAQSHALLESKRLNTSHLSEQQNVLNTRIRMDSAQLQRKAALQAPARISLSHPSNTNPARTSTPVSAPRLNASLYNTECDKENEQQTVLNTRTRMDSAQPQRKATLQAPARISLSHLSNPNPARTSTPVSAPRLNASLYNTERDKENVNSSPGFASFESPDRAYIQQKRPFSVVPDPQGAFRLSNLYHTPETPRQQANDTTASMGSINKSQENVKENMFQYFNSTISENEQLRAENRYLESTNAQLSRNVDDYRSNLNVLNEQLSAATSEVKNLRPALASARERLAVNESEIASLKASCANTKSELDAALSEHNFLKEQHVQETLENDRLRASVDTAKKGIAKLLIEYATLGEHFRELKKGHDSQKSLYTAVVKEFEQTKALAKSGLQALEPMLDDNSTMARAQDTKIVLKELHDDLQASQQVTDLLRNKLHHQSSQLADAQSRVSELEEEKRGSLKELLAARQEAKRECGLLMGVEAQIGELSARLCERERESMDALTTAAVREVELKAAKEQIDRYQKENETQLSELVSLRKVKEESVSSLLALQDVINTRDKEIISIKADVKALNESKSELRALLAENKKNLAEAETELRAKETTINACARDVVSLNAERKALAESKAELQTLLSEAKEGLADKVAELKLRNPNEDLLVRIRDLETTCGSLKAALEESQEQCILRERTLTQLEKQLTKKLHDAERANVELTSFNTALKESSASVQDQLRNVQAELKDALKAASASKEKCSALERGEKAEQERRQNLLAEIAAAKAELRALQEEFNAAKVAASNAVGKCSVLESNIKKAEKESKTTRESFLAEIADLKTRLEAQSVSLFQSKEAYSLSKEEIASLKERVVAAGEQRAMLQLALDKAQSLVKDGEIRASTAEKEIALAHARAADAKKSLAEVESKVTNLNRRIADAQQAANTMKSLANLKTEEHVKRLEDRIAELENTNEKLSARAEELWARYKDGRLTDKEKEFISYLIGEAQSIHEEDVVRKENELRRREHTIQALNTKVSDLQAVVARSIKTQGGVVEPSNQSIVDIKTWLASSPDHVPSDHDIGDVLEAPLPESHTKSTTRPDHEMDADSEDDIPLSELSRHSDPAMAGEDEKVSKKRTRPASPAPPAPAPEELIPTKRRTKNSIGKRAAPAATSVPALETKSTSVKYKAKKQRK